MPSKQMGMALLRPCTPCTPCTSVRKIGRTRNANDQDKQKNMFSRYGGSDSFSQSAYRVYKVYSPISHRRANSVQAARLKRGHSDTPPTNSTVVGELGKIER